MTAVDPTKTYHTLDGAGAAVPVPLTPSFWHDLATGALALPGGWLMMSSDVSEDMGHWEMHPNGEEMLICLSGAMRVIEEVNGAERETVLPAGHVHAVKHGLWHRICVEAPGRMMHLTWGEGTEHRPL